MVGEAEEPHLVVDVVLVEQRGLDGAEVAPAQPADLADVPGVVVVLVEHRPQARLLGHLEQLLAALEALEVLEHGRHLGLGRQPGLLHEDRQAVVDGQHHEPEGLGVLGDEVLDAGHHPVAGTALVEGVGVSEGVEPALGDELGHPGAQAALAVGLAVLGRDVGGVVVEVAAPVGPQHVVEDGDREGRTAPPGAVGQELQLVVDRVPVVVAVDEGGVHGLERGQHLEAERLVEVVAAGEALGVPGRVEGRHGVDDVQLGLGAEVVQHADGGLPAQGTDLDDLACSRGVQQRRDGDVPQREHGWRTTPLCPSTEWATGARNPSARPPTIPQVEPDGAVERRRHVQRTRNPRVRLLIGVLAVGAAVGAALPGGAAGAQQDGQGAAGVELEASAGFAGRYLVGRRLPITVDITADRLVRGTVEVQIDGLQGTWSVPVEVPGGSSKEVVLVVPTPAGFAVREVDVTLRDGGDEVASTQPEVEGLAEDELVGLLPGALPADLPEPVTLPGEVGTARFVRVELEQLAIPGLLDPIGTVVAGADEVGRLDAAGRAELLSWTDRGGRLVVDSAPSATVAGLPDDWQPDGQARRVAGLGEVRASSGRAAAGDWDAVVEATPTVSSQELAAFGWWGSGESLSDSLARDAGLDALDLPWLAGFVIAYIALCGPVAYFALRGRRNLGWVVVPGLAVVFTAAAFVVGDDLRAGTTTSHGTVLEVSSAGSRATTVVGAVSRSGADGEATFPAGWTVAPLDSTALGIDAGGPIAVTTTPDGAQAAIPLAAGDFGVARGTGPVAAAGDDGALRDRRGDLRGRHGHRHRHQRLRPAPRARRGVRRPRRRPHRLHRPGRLRHLQHRGRRVHPRRPVRAGRGAGLAGRVRLRRSSSTRCATPRAS